MRLPHDLPTADPRVTVETVRGPGLLGYLGFTRTPQPDEGEEPDYDYDYDYDAEWAAEVDGRAFVRERERRERERRRKDPRTGLGGSRTVHVKGRPKRKRGGKPPVVVPLGKRIPRSRKRRSLARRIWDWSWSR